MYGSDYIVSLSDFMMLSSLFVATGVLKAWYTACVVNATDPSSRLEITQRRRYSYIAFAQIFTAASGAYMLSFGGIDPVWHNMELWRQSGGIFDWIIWLMVALTLASPVVSFATALYVYKRPATLAKRVIKGHYFMTDDLRAGNPRIIRVEKTRDAYGILRKEFVPVTPKYEDTAF